MPLVMALALRALREMQTEQATASRRLAAAGQGVLTIAHATGLSVEQIEAILEADDQRRHAS